MRNKAARDIAHVMHEASSIERSIEKIGLAYILAHYLGFQGIFIAQVLANIFAGCVAIIWYRRVFNQVTA